NVRPFAWTFGSVQSATWLCNKDERARKARRIGGGTTPLLRSDEQKITITQNKYEIGNDATPSQRTPGPSDLTPQSDHCAERCIDEQPARNHPSDFSICEETRAPSDKRDQDERSAEKARQICADSIQRQIRQY